jgi:hypothetical protein
MCRFIPTIKYLFIILLSLGILGCRSNNNSCPSLLFLWSSPVVAQEYPQESEYVVKGANTMAAAMFVAKNDSELRLQTNVIVAGVHHDTSLIDIVSMDGKAELRYRVETSNNLPDFGVWRCVSRHLVRYGELGYEWSRGREHEPWRQDEGFKQFDGKVIWQAEYDTGGGVFFILPVKRGEYDGVAHWVSKSGENGVVPFKKGKYHGTARCWTASGELYSETQYNEGCKMRKNKAK